MIDPEPKRIARGPLREIQELVQTIVDQKVRAIYEAREKACYDLLMNGTDGASDESLEILGYVRTYPEDRL